MKFVKELSVLTLMYLLGFGTAYWMSRGKEKESAIIIHPVIHADRKNDGTFTISSTCPSPLEAHLVDPIAVEEYNKAHGDPISTINALASAICK